MSLPRYPKYRDSGVEWLGEVPEHWRVVPVNRIASILNGYPFDSRLFDPVEGIPLIRIRDLNQIQPEAYFKGEFVESAAITSNDVLIGMDGDFNVGRWRGEGDALLNQRMCCIRGNTQQITLVLEYALPTPLKVINDVSYATTVKHLSSSQVAKTCVALPQTEGELAAIITFLDRETGKIDALIAEQEKLLALLAEKRQATISHAVTKGLNPDAPMKDSGVGWLGDVPEHWKVTPLKHLVLLRSGGTPSKENLGYWDGDTPWASAKDLKSEMLADTIDHITEAAVESGNASLIQTGSVLVVVRGMILARTFPVVETLVPMAINQDLKGITPKPGLNSRFLAWLLRGSADESLRRLDEAGHGTKALRMDAWTTMRLPVPPIIEQSAIVTFIDRELARLDALTTEATRAITLLKERRTALISAAVTGKIDVRQAMDAAMQEKRSLADTWMRKHPPAVTDLDSLEARTGHGTERVG